MKSRLAASFLAAAFSIALPLFNLPQEKALSPQGSLWYEPSEPEIRSYVLSGEPLDKAGAYAVQGRASLWISHLNGNYSSVIGLPMNLVRSLLIRAGYDWK